MFISHIVIGKCVLNWIAQKLRTNKSAWKNKSSTYEKGYSSAKYLVNRHSTGSKQALVTTVED